jgi:hypothetical protein
MTSSIGSRPNSSCSKCKSVSATGAGKARMDVDESDRSGRPRSIASLAMRNGGGGFLERATAGSGPERVVFPAWRGNEFRSCR